MSSLRMRMPLSTNRSVATAHSSNSNVRQPLRLTPLRLTRRNLAAIIGVSGLVGPLTGPRPALARRLEGVNKPELLPKEKNKVVATAPTAAAKQCLREPGYTDYLWAALYIQNLPVMHITALNIF